MSDPLLGAGVPATITAAAADGVARAHLIEAPPASTHVTLGQLRGQPLRVPLVITYGVQATQLATAIRAGFRNHPYPDRLAKFSGKVVELVRAELHRVRGELHRDMQTFALLEAEVLSEYPGVLQEARLVLEALLRADRSALTKAYREEEASNRSADAASSNPPGLTEASPAHSKTKADRRAGAAAERARKNVAEAANPMAQNKSATPTVGGPGAMRVAPPHVATQSSAPAQQSRPSPRVLHGPVAMLDPATLTPHPLSTDLFGAADASMQAEFERDVAEHGIDKPLHIAGHGCASPPGTVYSGNRRREAALKANLLVPGIRLDGLSADEEAMEVIRGNLSDLHTRKLTEEQKFRAEKMLREILGRRQGQRTDLEGKKQDDQSATATWTDVRPGAGRAPKTSQTVAQKMGATRNAVEDRKKVFDSAVSTDELRAAVNAEKISRSAAATLVRATEMEHRPHLDEPAVQQAAKKKVNAALLALVEKNKTKKKSGPGLNKTAVPGSPTRAKAKQLVERLVDSAKALVQLTKEFGGDPKRVAQVAKLLSPATSGEVGRQVDQLVDAALSAGARTHGSRQRTVQGRS